MHASPKTLNVVNHFTHSLGMCLGMPLRLLLSPGPGPLLGSYVVNRVLAIRLVQCLKGILHQREKKERGGIY